MGATELRHGIITVLAKNATIETFRSFFARTPTVVRRTLFSKVTEKFVEKKPTN
jgi:hypothetical protein